jgi:hypothetical protein
MRTETFHIRVTGAMSIFIPGEGSSSFSFSSSSPVFTFFEDEDENENDRDLAWLAALKRRKRRAPMKFAALQCRGFPMK